MIRLVKTFWFVVTLRCEAADRLRSTKAGDLAWHERFAERAHTTLCKSCRRARRQLDLVNEAIAANRDRMAAGAGHALSAAEREALIRRLEIEREQS